MYPDNCTLSCKGKKMVDYRPNDVLHYVGRMLVAPLSTTGEIT